jgi:2-oxoglutarate dehydrogenase E1 component
MGTSIPNSWNLATVEAAYDRWKLNPNSVDESWRHFFQGFEFGASSQELTSANAGRVIRLIDAYRELGHTVTHLDPLSEPPQASPLLQAAEFGFREDDLERTFDTSHFLGLGQSTLRQLIEALRQTYCRTIGVEFVHIAYPPLRHWLLEHMEPCRNQPAYSRERRLRILKDLRAAELFEQFLHSNYVGQKRFSLEGAETLIPMLDALVQRAADNGVREIVLGMSHRGRLSVLANILGKPLVEIFNEFEENYEPRTAGGDGDVRYHLGFSADRTTEIGHRVHLSLSPNPSHLEAVDPVVEGRTRAKQDRFKDADGVLGMPVLIHGDAAFAGQGVVAETLNLSQLAGYRTGGTVHFVVNNQIGFTTSPADARSTRYCTDIAKMLDVPIFHVNAEEPEAAVFVTELAFDYRQTFHRDVFIDLVCYRRHGHNEGDEPSFTQPRMYAHIHDRPALGQVYAGRLVRSVEFGNGEVEAIDTELQDKMRTAKEMAAEGVKGSELRSFAGIWEELSPAYTYEPVETGVPNETLVKIGHALTTPPGHFQVHPKFRKQLERRRQSLDSGKPIDWSMAEAFAFGSLLLEGTRVRLSGQDSQRGTFSQRHAVLVDIETEEKFYPLSALQPNQAPFTIYDSPLSEAGVLGFEFGYALDSPDVLVLWEAQFGDFTNGAQVVIDQFLVCSQSKWQRDSGVVLLLPHGYEGQGPEHSNARPERFLQMCAEENIEVCNPTTPAQYFHLLRRQMMRKFRRPLVILTPKSLLRHERVLSPLDAFTSGSFQRILDDHTAKPEQVHRILLCSGKVYYDLVENRERDHAEVAILRIEQLYPLSDEQLSRALDRYREAREWIWVQE